MPERMEGGGAVPRVQCSSVKCKMNILKLEGAEMWWCCEGTRRKSDAWPVTCVGMSICGERLRQLLFELSDNWEFSPPRGIARRMFSENMFYWLWNRNAVLLPFPRCEKKIGFSKNVNVNDFNSLWPIILARQKTEVLIVIVIIVLLQFYCSLLIFWMAFL